MSPCGAADATGRDGISNQSAPHLAELVLFLECALSGGSTPIALGVPQILALNIGTDMLPPLALGAEPPSRTALQGPARTGDLID